MTVYIDADFRCHAKAEPGLTAVESDFFEGKCPSLIECYRFVPDGQTWTRADGEVFEGEMIAPYKDMTAALMVQLEYDQMAAHAGDYAAAYEEGVQSA